MDKKSKYLFIAFFSIIALSITISFFRYYINKDYYITVESECNPDTESCFVYECDPEFDAECPQDPEERVSYYKLIKISAADIPVCGQDGQNCPDIVCQPGFDCSEILCDPETAGEDDICVFPESESSTTTEAIGD